MRQVITLGAHIMNQNDQLIIFGSIIDKQNRFSENNLLQTELQSPTETLEWYKKKRKKPFFYIYSTKKLAQYSLTSVAVSSRLVVVRKPPTCGPMSRRP